MDSHKFLDLHYRTHPDTDNVTNIHGDQPRELEILWRNLKKK